LGKKFWNLSGFPSHSLESRGGAFLTEMFGQIFEIHPVCYFPFPTALTDGRTTAARAT
jgi:hypothetical protein